MQLPLLDSTSNFGTMMMNLMLATSECVYIIIIVAAPLTFNEIMHLIIMTSFNTLTPYTQLLFCTILVVAILIVVLDGGRI